MDNDGNLYATYWYKEEGGYDMFSEIVTDCREEIMGRRLFVKALTLMEIDEEVIRPTVYVPFVECIYRSGYKLNGKAGYLPNEFNVSLFRGHSTQRNYLPVGTRYKIKKKGASYLDTYRSVKACKEMILNDGGDGAEEVYSNEFISVSIESYSNNMATCLRNANFTVVRWSE